VRIQRGKGDLKMARRTATVTISAEGRDHGKQFFITEMPAMQAERWATKALLALSKSKFVIPEDIAKAGLAGIAALGKEALAGLSYEDAAPLLEEMLRCVKIIPDPSRPAVMRSDIECDIEEVSTLLTLRTEVFSLHVNFSPLVVTSTSTLTTSTPGRQNSRNM
jgi:hypothetical protein